MAICPVCGFTLGGKTCSSLHFAAWYSAISRRMCGPEVVTWYQRSMTTDVAHHRGR